jgi:murein DD-endopeptidase MepM/ murein hydrolase activator NlpD
VRFDSPPPASTTPPRNAPKDALRFTGFTFRPEATRDIQVGLTSSGKFTAVASDRELTSRPQYVTGQIDDSLYNAAQAVKMPVSVLAKMIRIFSFDVDFQREVRRGDGFEVLYNQAFDVNGAAVPITEIVFASMTLSKTPRPYYRYTPASGVTDYFDRRGQSVKKTLMRTPVDGARLSSGFGRRKHPILGYTKLHRGADFAAPTGTPIMAAGDGVIVSLGRNGHYGKYIQIRHNSTYSTAYAHMSAYRRGLKRGSRVRQGQTIGYVGSTGRSTGPHLHYEVLVNGKQRNPLGLKLPSGEQLRGKDLANFKLIRDEIDRQRNSLQPKPAIAQQ